MAAPKVWDAGTNVPRPSEDLPRPSGDRGLGLPRDPARPPHSAPFAAGFVDGVEQLVGVETFVAAAEVGRGGATADELHVHVQLSCVDVAEETPVPVIRIEIGIGLDRDPLPRPGQSFELALRLPCVALALPELGSVDLDEPHTRSAAKVERVAVADPRDRRARPLSLLVLPGAARERRDDGDEHDEAQD